jgi:thymidylate kinase
VLQHVLGTRLALRMVSLVGKSARIAAARRLGRLVLLDRYTSDADLPHDHYDWKGRVSAALVRRTVSQPDLVLVLDAPGQLMFERKGEHSVAELQAGRDGYLRMVGSFRHAAVIDASEPRDVVRRRATRLIWRRWSGGDLTEPGDGVPPERDVPLLREEVPEL